MSSVDPDLRTFKTDAWKPAAHVATYAEQVGGTGGFNRLKNTIERELIERWVTGTEIIDVGIGTGRASIPLARSGKHVTGIDSSQAMLDRARVEAGPTELELRVGDIEELPVPSGAFDSLISLNVAVHFPHWQRYLLEWKRVVRPDGRLIFDMFGTDNVEAVARLTGIPVAALLARESWHGTFLARIGWRELLAFCDLHDLTVEAIVPHGLLYGEVDFQLNEGLARGVQLERVLSAMAVDERLFEFGRFLHHDLIARLSPETTDTLMIVLRNAPDRAANAAFRTRTDELNARFAGGLTFEQLAPYLGMPADAWRTAAMQHLAYEPNVVLAALLLSAMPPGWFRPELFDAAFGPAIGGRLRRLRELHAIDRAVEQLGGRWYDEAVTHRGVELGGLARDGVTQALLDTAAPLRSATL